MNAYTVERWGKYCLEKKSSYLVTKANEHALDTLGS